MGFAFTCCGAEQSLSSRLLPWGAGALLFFLWLPLFLLGFANLSFKQKSLLKILRLLLGGKLDTELAGACCNCRVKGKGLPAQPATSSNQQQPAALALWDWVVLLLSFCPLFLLESCVGSAAGMGWFGARCLGDAGRAVLFGEVLACFGLEEPLKILF